MIVILTEKPSVAKDIAAHLGAKAKHDGYFQGNGYQVTWAFGHLITLKEPDEYDPVLKKWSLHSLPFLPEKFELKVVDDKGIKKQFGIIKNLFSKASDLISATDAGREGELIFRYILSMTECEAKPAKRLWLSSLTEEALTSAFNNLKPLSEYDNLYKAAKCRSEADWIVGLNATRNFTVRYGRGKILWSVGRVQTPVLAMIVRRDDEIRHFTSEPFWELFTKYRDVAFKMKGDRFKTKEEAEAMLAKVKDAPFTIDKVSAKKENEHPPLLFDLTELQREMNRKFGMTAADTLQIAQTLYEQKFITYPRTDSRYLSNDMKGKIAPLLTQLKKIRAKELEPLNLAELNFSNRIINDKKVTDHHAIIPTGTIPHGLSHQSQAVYDAISIRLIATFYPTCVKEVTQVDGNANKVLFQAKGTRIVTPGWTVLYPKKSDEQQETQELPLFVQGETGPHEPYVIEGKTKPPAHFNENALLGAMETAGKLVEDEALKEALKEKGIGTPATRASIIETLIRRGYIERSGKTLIATDLGRYLIALIQDPNLKSAELTGDWECRLKEIEKGVYSDVDFMKQIAQFTKDVLKGSDINKLNETTFGDCPKCKNPIIKGNKGYGCSKWKEGCTFVLWKTFNGIELAERQIRTLLQKKILPHFQGNTCLALSHHGILAEITLPTAQTVQAQPKPQKQAKKSSVKK